MIVMLWISHHPIVPRSMDAIVLVDRLEESLLLLQRLTGMEMDEVAMQR